MFVKENYASIKKSNNRFKHADVMRVLGQEFARKATIAVDWQTGFVEVFVIQAELL